MQSHYTDSEFSNTEELTSSAIEPTQFHSRFVDCMEMYADAPTVARYFDAHHGWFCRCAQPMTVEPLGENSYALVVGRFGSFGYEVEPKIGLDLLPEDQGIYRIQAVPIPGYDAPGYDVDFQAAMELVEVSSRESSNSPTGNLTRVQWQLDLTVTIQFPRFIRALPKSLIQSTGDRLLRQVVRQVSQRLTRKVQEDFHGMHGVQLPKG
ncbi:DUF1997 domain-containing protein [Leptolyngbya sp. FACHB-36]|uniref:DUF1997 domain-containing protein n=1 Tax=Leptolyngbya sp. FACHB-36 TaxID=2692808 RepID=UPI001680D2E6|nr:DUF1997 domain-containing protein [Leptolyngbya sp. FACHB-36]MBD2020378.1 DUF1997 domain-containing protein [Leptolyngbya sp. FACHB-36]